MRLLVIFLALLLAACFDLDRSVDPAGPDLDRNGIRDDIDTWISKQGFTKEQSSAASQYARIKQRIITGEIKTREQARSINEKIIRSRCCIRVVFGDSGVAEILRQSIGNTRARMLRENNFGLMMDGMTFEITPTSMLKKEDVCD